jgi:hypothetical protein
VLKLCLFIAKTVLIIVRNDANYWHKQSLFLHRVRATSYQHLLHHTWSKTDQWLAHMVGTHFNRISCLFSGHTPIMGKTWVRMLFGKNTPVFLLIVSWLIIMITLLLFQNSIVIRVVPKTLSDLANNSPTYFSKHTSNIILFAKFSHHYWNTIFSSNIRPSFSREI